MDLHVTNGDSAASLIRESGLPGRVLPWRDVLHEGPVPGRLGFAQLREVRAHFIAERGWGEEREVRADLDNHGGKLKPVLGVLAPFA